MLGCGHSLPYVIMYIDEAISYNKKEHLISHVECCQKKFAPPNS